MLKFNYTHKIIITSLIIDNLSLGLIVEFQKN
jgi:hypothetical protein